MSSLVVAPLLLLLGLIGWAALIVEIVAFAIAAKAPAAAYVAAAKLSKGAWVAITAVAMVIGLGSAPLPLISAGGRFGGLLSIAGLVAALVFLVDVRPALKRHGGSAGNRPSGPSRPGGW
ncbi:MAG: DUF2516 family protein [Bifidobacteriaceae bacterium]|jgi:hypothetical protein|nr:DUF2516 family protein [Bifidobacteriaceae bacterium]